MIRRTTKHVVELTAALFAVIVILVGGVVWLLASGPVPLTVFKPTVANALARSLNAAEVDFSEADILWIQEDRVLELRVRDARIIDTDGSAVAEMPTIAVALSARGLARGRIAPTRIAFAGASARFIRRADGGFGLGLMAPEAAPAATPVAEDPVVSSRAFDLLRQLSGPADADGPLAYLEAVEIREARIDFDDMSTGIAVTALDASLLVTRRPATRADGTGLSLLFEADLTTGLDSVHVEITGASRPEGDGFDVTARFDDVALAALRDMAPAFERLAPLDLPVSGEIRVQLAGETLLGPVAVDLLGGPGRYDLPETDTLPMVEAEHMGTMLDRLPPHVPIRSLALSARFDPGSGRVDIDRATLRTDRSDVTLGGEILLGLADDEDWAVETIDARIEGRDLQIDVPVYSEAAARFDRLRIDIGHDLTAGMTVLREARIEAYGGTVALDGRFGLVEGKPEVFLNGSVARFPADRLMTIWPMGMSVGARTWIGANITQGRIGTGTLKLEAPAGTFDVGYIPNDAMRFDFSLEDMTVRFVPGVPPMTDLQGSATLLGNTFIGRFDEARIGRIAISEGRMLTENLNVRGSYGIFDAVADGPLPDVLTVLDMGPFGYPSRYGIDPAQSRGKGGVRLHVELPMKKDLKIEQIEFSAAANVQEFGFDGLPGIPMRDGTVALEINGAGLRGTGDIVVADLPTNIVWTEDFTGQSEHPTMLRIATVLDDAARDRLGLTLGEIVSGPIDVSTTAFGRGKDLARVTAEADLMGTVLRIPGTSWEKPADSPVRAVIDASFPGEGGVAIDRFSVDGEDVAIQGGFLLGPNFKLQAADFPKIRINGLADLSAAAAREKGLLDLSIRGSYLNADPLFDLFELGAGGPGGETDPAAPPTEAVKSPVSVSAEVARIDLQRDVALRDATATVRIEDMSLEDVALRAGIGTGGTAHVALSRKTDKHRTLIATATDAGALARGFLDTDAIADGQVRLNAVLTDPLPDDPDSGEIEGNLTIEDFRVVNAPLLARILTAGSPTGIGDLLQGDGIRFTELSLPFESREGIWTLHEGRAYGPSIGITVDGGLDEDMKATDLRGTIVPAYGVNSALGKVPLIGDVFINKDGEGLFAFTYRVVGSDEGSSIYVNPLSGLAPGFLRRLFQLGGSDDDEDP